jgi:hypothetical protein
VKSIVVLEVLLLLLEQVQDVPLPTFKDFERYMIFTFGS